MHSSQFILLTQRSMRLKACYIIYCLLIVFSNTLIDNTTYAFDTIQMRRTCSELTRNSQCRCSTMMSDFRIECPSTEPFPKITLSIRPGIQVRILCNRIVANEYQLLPQLSIGSHPVVQISHCPLPGGHTPISRIFTHLGVTQVKTLFFESNDLGTNLTSLHFRGLQGLSRLRFSSNGLSHMPSDLFTDLKNLTWLDLRSNNVELPPNIFSTLENLHYLELGHNNLQQLPLGIFRNQRKLIHLNLWSNQLRNLSKQTFAGLSVLTDIDLSANGIEHFAADVFELLFNLTNINLSANHFRQLPRGLFSKNKNLSQFRLRNNRVMLATLPEEFLANLPHLNDVHIEACDLASIPDNLFANSSEVTTLTLADNRLVELPSTLLADQYRLNDLDLSHNLLTSLSNGLFRNTKQLAVLKLSHNQLSEISSELFAPLTQLELLYLDNNRLTIIDPDAFMYTLNIRSISMANNQLNFNQSHIPDQQLIATPFQHLQELGNLNLSNNSIIFIYSDWKLQLSVLENLDLSYNYITALNEDDLRFYSTKNITLNLAQNQIQSINFKDINVLKDTTSNNRSLVVELNGNPIVCDCKLLSFVQYLGNNSSSKMQSVNLQVEAKQLLCNEPSNLQGKNVKELSLSSLLCPYGMAAGSTQQRCPNTCECWKRSYDSVLMVNCTHGNLTEVPRLPILDGELKSTELYLTGNNLTQLPVGSTPGYADVTKIYAADNHITQLEAINLPPRLMHLNLSRNGFEVFNISAVTFFNASVTLSSLALSDNPLICSCQNVPLLSFALEHQEIIEDFKQIQCIDPLQPSKQKKFQDLSVSDICPMDKRAIIIIAVSISVLSCLIGIALALFYKYQLEIKAWLFKHNLCLRFIIEEEEWEKDKKYDAFISYSRKDEDFVTKYLLPQLEEGPRPFKLYVHVRDFIVGEVISEQIVQSMEDSRRIIVVLSPSFIESVWSQYEFKKAHKAALNEGRARIIAIMYRDIGDIDELDSDLKSYLKMNTYLSWGDRWFWEKLRYAMPHSYKYFAESSYQPSNAEDKLELIIPAPVSPMLTTPPSDYTKNPLVAYLNGDRQAHQASVIPNGNMKTTTNGHINESQSNARAKQSDV